MHELVRTNNAVLITAIEALLKGAEIPHVVLDQHMSVLEGSLGMLPRRIVVSEDFRDSARQLMADAGLAHELRSLPGHEGRAETTDDAVLGGRLRLIQKRKGHRVGHDAILLAAATPARAGDRAVDFGAGVGAAGLALAMRVPGVSVWLVELDPDLAAIAAQNAIRNGLQDRVSAFEFDVASPEGFLQAGLEPGSADVVLMNPPFNNPARQNVSPDASRRVAHVADGDVLATWIDAAHRLLHSAGTVTLIWRADGLADVLAALAPEFGGLSVLPVHGREGAPAIRVIVRGQKGARVPLALLPGLMLNNANGRPTEAAEDILRRAQALPM